jgi:pimeloyl-ACP methyl ester carboxylesterase
VKAPEFNRLIQETRHPKPQYRGSVITVHGMNTDGAWQKRLSVHFQDWFLRHIPVTFGKVVAGVLRRRKSEEVAEEIVDAYKSHKSAGIVSQHVVAHSYGTLSTTRTLELNPDIRLNRIILFGGIVPRDYRWADFVDGKQIEGMILNESCPRDRWPKHAAHFIYGAGSSGCCGFEPSAFVVERRYGYTEHSGLATDLHCIEAWIPFLLSGQVTAQPVSVPCDRSILQCPAGLNTP